MIAVEIGSDEVRRDDVVVDRCWRLFRCSMFDGEIYVIESVYSCKRDMAYVEGQVGVLTSALWTNTKQRAM